MPDEAVALFKWGFIIVMVLLVTQVATVISKNFSCRDCPCECNCVETGK